MNINLIKDLFISILIVICIVLIISVVFYDKISLTKIVPESEEYTLTEEMQQELNENNKDKETSEDIDTITYRIDEADLKKYEKTKEYNKGKKNPFAVESDETITNNVVNGDNINLDNTSSINNSTNFYEDDGTK